MSEVQTIDDVVLYEVRAQVAVITMDRPEYNNAQNSQMTYALDKAFQLACNDDEVTFLLVMTLAPLGAMLIKALIVLTFFTITLISPAVSFYMLASTKCI